MNASLVLRLSLAVQTIVLVGCASQPEDDYSPGYSYIATAGGSGKGDGSVLVPDACLGKPADTKPTSADTPMTIIPDAGPHLPPGCANAYNLQRMAESERDLVEGRRMGTAAAAPTTRAARRYIYGEEAPLGGAHPAPDAPDENSP